MPRKPPRKRGKARASRADCFARNGPPTSVSSSLRARTALTNSGRPRDQSARASFFLAGGDSAVPQRAHRVLVPRQVQAERRANGGLPVSARAPRHLQRICCILIAPAHAGGGAARQARDADAGRRRASPGQCRHQARYRAAAAPIRPAGLDPGSPVYRCGKACTEGRRRSRSQFAAADAGRFEDLDRLAIAARNDFAFVLALNSCAVDAGPMLPRAAVRRTLKICVNRRIALVPKDIGWRESVGDEVPAVTKLVQAACHHRLGNKRKLAGLLTRYLPERPPFVIASRHSIGPDERSIYLKAYVLRAELSNRSLGIRQLVPDQLRAAARNAADHDPE